MSRVVCYPRCCKPTTYDENVSYFEVFSSPETSLANVGHVGIQILNEMRRSQIHPSVLAFDFLMLSNTAV